MTKQPNPPRAATRTRRHQTIILTPSTGPAGPCVSLITGKVFELPPDANESFRSRHRRRARAAPP